MLVANSFDLWRRDSFFSAAEEVQYSADILESTYRSWVREKREESSSLHELQDLRKDLQTALGTAKWQLEEFDRAVRSSYGSCRDQSRLTRHQQFIVAIESQISKVENALSESLDEEGKQSLQWVKLNEAERDDLAMFLSGSSGNSTKSTRDESTKPLISLEVDNLCKRKDLDYATCNSSRGSMEFNSQTKDLSSLRNDVVMNVGIPSCATEVGAREGALRLNSSDDNDELMILMPTDGDTSKEKGLRTSNFLCLREVNGITKLFKGSSGMNSRLRSCHRIQLNPSLRLVIVLMLSGFVLVPFFIHSS